MAGGVAGEELLDSVRAALPGLEAEAAESERLRRPTDRAIEILRGTRCLEQLVPRKYGGLELDLDSFLECAMTLGEADASLAWVANFYTEHNWLFCHMPEEFQRELFSQRPCVLAPAAIAGESSVREVDGGFVLDGRWRFGSGAMHAEWVMVGGASRQGDPTSAHFYALPAEQVTIDDVWHTAGLRATGSNDILVEEAFVPTDHAASLVAISAGNGPASKLHAAEVYQSPMVPVLMTAAATPTIGQARAAVRRFREKTAERTRPMSQVAERDRAGVQMRLAESAHETREAELVMRDVIGEVMRLRASASLEQRVRWALGMTRAVHGARRAIHRLADAGGASGQFEHDPLQRAVRDANAAASHIAFDWDARHQGLGGVMLGVAPNTMLF